MGKYSKLFKKSQTFKKSYCLPFLNNLKSKGKNQKSKYKFKI